MTLVAFISDRPSLDTSIVWQLLEMYVRSATIILPLIRRKRPSYSSPYDFLRGFLGIFAKIIKTFSQYWT